MSHIQKTAPGPPATTAIATPAILPTPTREAVEMQNAWKEEIPPSPTLEPAVLVIKRTISLMQRICTKPLPTVNQVPKPTNMAIKT